MMYKSREIRWFTRTKTAQIIDWFALQNLSFAATEARTDFYLPLPGRDDMSIKLREANIEIKQRIAAPESGKLTKNAAGYFESWVKWSFKVDKEDGLSKAIILQNRFGWTEVYKERIGVKLIKGENGKTKIIDIKDVIPTGCQMEYTRIVIKEQEWFTFGLEWFGENPYSELNDALLSEVLGDSVFNMEDSMGYVRFLNQSNP